MEIYLLRHGIAEDAAPGMRDADRALTPKGRKKLQDVLERAREAGVKPSIVLTSPLLRARQTAEIAAEVFGYTDALIATDALLPESSPQKVWDEIRLHKDAAQLLLSSHEPLCGSVYRFLLSSPNLLVDVKKGSIGRIDMDRIGLQPRGVLKWLITPATAG